MAYSLVVALAAQISIVSSFVEDSAVLLEIAVGLLKSWALLGSIIESGLEIISSLHRKQRLQSHSRIFRRKE